MKKFNLSGGSRNVATFAAAVLLTISMPLTARADVVSTERLYSEYKVETVRGELKNYVAREEVRTKMLDLGIDQGSVEQRIDSLTDQEVLEMYENIDSMPAGEGFFGAVISLLVIFILLDVAGVTDIFPAV